VSVRMYERAIPEALMQGARERVREHGVPLLDNYFGAGEWEPRIERDTLDMTSACSCVLGQLFDGAIPNEKQLAAWCAMEGDDPADYPAVWFEQLGYYAGRAIIDGPILTEQGAREHGFHADSMAEYRALQQAWNEVLDERLGPA
jgi:hypothetical protein